MSNMHNIPITIADILIQLQSPLSVSELGIEQRLGQFFGAPGNSVARVSLCWKECDDMPSIPGDEIFNAGPSWQMYRVGSEYYTSIGRPNGGAATSAKGVLRANAAWDELTLTEQRTGVTWQSLLNTVAGQLLLLTKVLFIDGLVLHASGIDDNGHGIVFVGHSGVGKSTQARLWSSVPGVIVMNGDCIAVRSSTSGAVCYGTPWGGSDNIARNHQAPLSTLILLEQAPENEIRPIPPAAAASLLAARAFLPYWDQSLMQRAMVNLEALLARVPVYRLRCRPEPAVIPLVRSVL